MDNDSLNFIPNTETQFRLCKCTSGPGNNSVMCVYRKSVFQNKGAFKHSFNILIYYKTIPRSLLDGYITFFRSLLRMLLFYLFIVYILNILISKTYFHKDLETFYFLEVYGYSFLDILGSFSGFHIIYISWNCLIDEN